MRRFTISLSALLALGAPAIADERIGAATLIEKDVNGVSSGRKTRLNIGDDVYFDELLTTGVASRGNFAFKDRANLQMGPSSAVKLDNFVYAKAPAVAFTTARGVFRFASAPAGHKGYEVRTPRASIGVRGTAFGVRAAPARTDAVLYEGSIEVCLPAGGACRVLDKPCTFLTVTAAGFTETRDVGPDDWSFDDSCKRKSAPRKRRGAVEAPPPGIAPRRVEAPPPARKNPSPRVQTTKADPPRPVAFRPRPAPPAEPPPPRVKRQKHYDPPPVRRPPPTRYPRPEPDPEDDPGMRPRPFFPRFPAAPHYPPVMRPDYPYRPHFPRGPGSLFPPGGRDQGPRQPPIMRGPGFPGRGGWGGRW